MPTTTPTKCGAVRVCPERDVECGQFPRAWCSTCPKRLADAALQFLVDQAQELDMGHGKPQPVASIDGLPPLPKAKMLQGANLDSLHVLYTAGQMRAYAIDAQRATRPAEAPADNAPVTWDQAVMLAGVQALCISADQEWSRQGGMISDFDKGWFSGQLHIFDLYTTVEKSAVEQAREYIGKLSATSRPAPAMVAPAGWQLVPKVPTEGMLDSAHEAHDAPDEDSEAEYLAGYRRTYRAMLAAAPAPDAGIPAAQALPPVGAVSEQDKDAARYRFLRNDIGASAVPHVWQSDDSAEPTQCLHGDELDAAIDAAIQADKEPT